MSLKLMLLKKKKKVKKAKKVDLILLIYAYKLQYKINSGFFNVSVLGDLALALKPSADSFKIRPNLSEKFRPGPVQYWIEKSITDIIGEQPYSPEESPEWAKKIVKEILEKTKAMKFGRYKLIAQVVLGERKGQGLSSAQRCLWDSDADCYASYTYTKVISAVLFK